METDPELVRNTAKVVDLDAEDGFGDLKEIGFDKGKFYTLITLVHLTYAF